MVADRVTDNDSSATHNWERGRLVPKIGLQMNSCLQPIKGGCRWLQMVADKAKHLQPR